MTTRAAGRDHDLWMQAQRLYASGDMRGAASILADLAKRHPANADYRSYLGTALQICGEFGGAIEHLERAIALGARNAPNYHDLALSYRNSGRFDEAGKTLEKGLATLPDDPILLRGKAELHHFLGQQNEAYDVLAPAIARGADHPAIALALGKIGPKVGRSEEAIAYVARHASDESLSRRMREMLLFQLGDLLDRAGRYDEAFEAYRKANALRPERFDSVGHSRAIDMLITAWSADAIARLPRASARTGVPVFIVGMPRSGTTLVEQIIAAHPSAHGAGELQVIISMVGTLQPVRATFLPTLTNLSLLTQPILDQAAQAYLAYVRRLAPDALRVTDKMPYNFLNLGFISRVFPDARIVHCVRDARDTCLSCYFQRFTGNHPFAYDLRALGLFHRDYERLMAHWKRVLGVPMLDVVYEDLVAEPEAGIRRLLEFVNLPWDPACLEFHATERVAVTASNDQVRRAIYRSSTARHAKYASHLGPLLEALGQTEGAK